MASAYDDAVRALSRRPLTRREIEDRLRSRGHPAEDVDETIARLTAERALDDEALARNLIEKRGRSRGQDRAVAELVARGIPEAAAQAAWKSASDEGAIDVDAALARAVSRRLGPPPGRASLARLARVYNALLSEGFEREPVEAALAPYGLERIEP